VWHSSFYLVENPQVDSVSVRCSRSQVGDCVGSFVVKLELLDFFCLHLSFFGDFVFLGLIALFRVLLFHLHFLRVLFLLLFQFLRIVQSRRSLSQVSCVCKGPHHRQVHRFLLSVQQVVGVVQVPRPFSDFLNSVLAKDFLTYFLQILWHLNLRKCNERSVTIDIFERVLQALVWVEFSLVLASLFAHLLINDLLLQSLRLLLLLSLRLLHVLQHWRLLRTGYGSWEVPRLKLEQKLLLHLTREHLSH